MSADRDPRAELHELMDEVHRTAYMKGLRMAQSRCAALGCKSCLAWLNGDATLHDEPPSPRTIQGRCVVCGETDGAHLPACERY